MKKIIFISAALCILSGCASTTKAVKTTEYPERTVTVAYMNGFDNSALIKQSALDAQKYCGKKAKPISEETKKELDGNIPVYPGVPSFVKEPNYFCAHKRHFA